MPSPIDNLFNQNNLQSAGSSNYERASETLHVRACTNCVRAKARCSMTTGVEGQGVCTRCSRMKKICQASPPMRRNRGLKKSPHQETSKLEEKLDGLVTLLKSATQGMAGTINSTAMSSDLRSEVHTIREGAPGTASVAGNSFHNYATASTSPVGRGSDSTFTPTDSSSELPTPSSSINLRPVLCPDLEPSLEEAELCLNTFRSKFIKHLPFIYIPFSTSAHQLRQERPLLWFSIMTVASSNSTSQLARSKEIKALLARETFVEGTRNMDILLATLTYAVWDRRCFTEKPVMMSLVQLAIGILYELGLDKMPTKDPAVVIAYDIKGTKRPSALTRTPTMEERRALLACYLMSSVVCSTLRKGSTLTWTSYSNECLRILDEAAELESDALLVQLVKIRLISNKVYDMPWSGAAPEGNNFIRTPMIFYLKSLRAQVEDFKAHIPSSLRSNQTLLMEVYTTETSIHEVGFSQIPDIFGNQNYQRIECLWACLNTSKSWVEDFLTIKPADYVGFSAGVYSNMLHCIILLYRLTVFEHAEWDRTLVQDTLDVPSFLDRAESNFAQVKEAAGLDLGGSKDSDTFSSLAIKIRMMRISWCAKDPAIYPRPSLGLSQNDEVYDFPMQLSDDDWLRDLIGPWNEA